MNRNFRNKYSESDAHLELKERAIYWLRDRGYSTSTETQICIEGKSYRVDVVGFKDGESIAVECGRTRRELGHNIINCINNNERYENNG